MARPSLLSKITESGGKVNFRVCLRCKKKFLSEGPHNRICPECKDTKDYKSGLSLADIVHTIDN